MGEIDEFGIDLCEETSKPDPRMTLEMAVQEIKWALVSYVEECLGDDKDQQKDIDDAWNLILENLPFG
jgi:hypothetical protein